jgi:hypothetical protein
MLVKNEILWYKLSIRRIEFSALSNANEERRGEIAGTFREWRAGEKNLGLAQILSGSRIRECG